MNGEQVTDPGVNHRKPNAPQDARDPPETESERRLVNLLIVGFILFILGAGLWLGDALLEARRMDECISSGRRNCAPIAVPQPPPR